MKRSLRISALVLAAGVAALPGCATKAPIPLAENFDLTVQPKVRSAGHWDLLSNDVVTQTLASLKASGWTLDADTLFDTSIIDEIYAENPDLVKYQP